jgi:hypothetical protein
VITIHFLSLERGWESNRTYDRTVLGDQSNVGRTDRALMLMGCKRGTFVRKFLAAAKACKTLTHS